jgi:hypothetical protein
MMRAQMKGKTNYLQVVNVSINYALLKRFTKKLGQEFKTTNIDFSVKIAMKTITIISIVSSASRFTPTITKTKMMISG